MIALRLHRATESPCEGVAVAPVSGLHHACYAEGGGYYTLNGLVVAACVLRREGRARRVDIVDFDEHYGNGTVDIIRHLRLDRIEHFSAAADWNCAARRRLFSQPSIMRRFDRCDVLLYRPGADPPVDEPLGGSLSFATAIESRRECRSRGLWSPAIVQLSAATTACGRHP